MQITAILTPDDTAKAAVTNANSTSETSSDFSAFLDEATSADSSLAPIFQEASETYGVSMKLLTAMAKQESNFQADVTSKSGAMGIMQLMPSTAEYLGVTDAYDPKQNIMGGAKYISQLLTQYDGDTSLALAAYNAGSNNVDKYGGIPPFEETQNYVTKITSYMEGDIALPDGTVITGDSSQSTLSQAASSYENTDSSALNDALSKLFSYEDYQKFLGLFADSMQSSLAAVLTDKLTGASSTDTASNTGSLTSSAQSLAASAETSANNTTTDVSTEKKTLSVTVTSSSNVSTDALYASQNIHYNKSVLDLLSQTGDSTV